MDCYNLFIQYSKQLCMTKDDYKDKQKVKAHNKAMKSRTQLKNKIKQQNCEEILGLLLIHDDERVQIGAAVMCLQENVLQDQAVSVLKTIVKCSTNPIFSFDAEMLLKLM